MFAYCGNNPVSRCDPSGQLWLLATIATVVVGTVTSLYYKTKVNATISDHADNDPDKTTFNKIINDQNGATGNDFRYGLYSAEYNSCEVIAVHNAKVLKGIDSSLSGTMRTFQSSYAMIGFGTLGSDPNAIGRVLSREGIEYCEVSNPANMTLYGTYIMSFWNRNTIFGGLHTIAVSYNGTEYTAYNLKGNGRTYSINLSDYKDTFICGYYLF